MTPAISNLLKIKNIYRTFGKNFSILVAQMKFKIEMAKKGKISMMKLLANCVKEIKTL